MKYIHIDTNVFVGQNFLEGRYINELLEFSKKGDIRIILTQVTLNEVKKQFKEKVQEAFNEYKKYMKVKEVKYLRNTDFGRKVNDYSYDKIKVDTLSEEFNLKFDKVIKESNVEVLPYLTNIDTARILEAYFDEKPPFSSKKDKKLGFPDAFIIENIKNWIKENNTDITILSYDNDFVFLKEEYDFITISNNIREEYNLISNEIKLREEKITKERLSVLDRIYYQNKTEIDQYLEDYFKYGVLDDESLYYSYTTENIYDISNLKIMDIVHYGYNLKNVLDEEQIEIEILVDLHFTINVLTDDINAYVYDREDRVVYYMDQENIEVSGKVEIRLTGIAYIISDDEHEDSINLELNSDSYEIHVYREGYY
ncbi:MAG: PIN domain-containing protein [Bacteroidota bacterium]